MTHRDQHAGRKLVQHHDLVAEAALQQHAGQEGLQRPPHTVAAHDSHHVQLAWRLHAAATVAWGRRGCSRLLLLWYWWGRVLSAGALHSLLDG